MPVLTGELAGTPLTFSGNEITDTIRALAAARNLTAGQMVDGPNVPGGIGIWRAATNLFGYGQALTTGLWFGPGTDVTGGVDSTAPPYGTAKSIKCNCDGVAARGVRASTATGLALLAGTACCGSVWFLGNVGQTYKQRLRILNTAGSGGGNTDSVTTTFVATGGWQLLLTPVATVAAGKVGDQLQIIVSQNAALVESFRVSLGMIEAGQTVVAPYVTTTGGVTATNPAARVQAPTDLLDETQMWMAFWFRYGWGTASMPDAGTGSRYLFDWRAAANSRISVWFDEANRAWNLLRRNPVGQLQVFSAAQTVQAGDSDLVVAAMDASSVKVSINGGPAVTQAGAISVPSLGGVPLADLGTQAGGSSLDGAIRWAGFGTGTITDQNCADLYDRLNRLGVLRHVADIPGWNG